MMIFNGSQMAYGSPHYVAGQRVGGSPQAAASPHLTTSPQVPSPQGQTLDLSVNRLPHRYVTLTPQIFIRSRIEVASLEQYFSDREALPWEVIR